MSCHGALAFPRGRAALAPAVTADMSLRQWRIVTALDATGAELHRNYGAGHWMPHVSVATRAGGPNWPRIACGIVHRLAHLRHAHRTVTG